MELNIYGNIYNVSSSTFYYNDMCMCNVCLKRKISNNISLKKIN